MRSLPSQEPNAARESAVREPAEGQELGWVHVIVYAAIVFVACDVIESSSDSPVEPECVKTLL